MPILRLRRIDGTWMEIPALVGPKGDSFTYEDFTPEQLASLKGETGEVDYSRLEDYATKKKVEDDIAEHNTSPNAHNDIRLLIEGLTSRLNALANSDDETLDQMAELVAYIKDNRGLIEQVTTNKVNVSDIIDNLETNVANKPLSAAQGVALKALIDAIPAWAKEENKPSYGADEITGIMPLSKGGTGAALSVVANAIIRYSANSEKLSSTATADGALYATSSKGTPKFGTLPIAQGGTGATNAETARANIGAAAAEHVHEQYLTAQALEGYALKTDIPTLSTETWTFTLEDGTEVTKAVYIG